MPFSFIIWDLDDDPDGNVQHCLDNDVTIEEVDEVVQDPKSGKGTSRSSGRPTIFGLTRAGRPLVVVYDLIDDDTIYPVTAYEPEPEVTP